MRFHPFMRHGDPLSYAMDAFDVSSPLRGPIEMHGMIANRRPPARILRPSSNFAVIPC